jgi:hypothetical protein
MSFTSWLQECRTLATREHARRSKVKLRPQVEGLEDRKVPSFLAPSGYSAGSASRALVAADLNADGRSDLISVGYDTNSVAVLLASGSGFANATSYGVGASPTAVAVGDVNGDGKLDLITANWGGNSISILLGDGKGAFAAAHDYAAGTQSFAVALGDLNGDGKLDVVTGNNDGTVSVLLNNGDGTFGAAHSYAVAGPQFSLAVADFTGDGKADVLTRNWGTVSLLAGNGDGTLGIAQTVFSTSTSNLTADLTALAVGDFNHDGKLDFAVTATPTGLSVNIPQDSILVCLNNGGGSFSIGGTFFSEVWETNSLVAADINGDGNLDLVTAGQGSNGFDVSVLLGTGAGGFGAAQYTGVPQAQSETAFVAVGDFNGDHFADVAVAYMSGSQVDVLLNAGSGSGHHKHK